MPIARILPGNVSEMDYYVNGYHFCSGSYGFPAKLSDPEGGPRALILEFGVFSLFDLNCRVFVVCYCLLIVCLRFIISSVYYF